MKKTVLIDLDSICADIMTPWLSIYNTNWDDDLILAEVTNWDFHNLVKPECGTLLYKILHRKDFFLDLEPLPGAIKGVGALEMLGHDVLIVTAGADVPDAAEQKIRWCKKHLGIDAPRIVVTPRKELIHGDVLIDDSPKQIAKYRENHPKALITGIQYPYNESVRELCNLFDGYKDTESAWRQIVNLVHKGY